MCTEVAAFNIDFRTLARTRVYVPTPRGGEEGLYKCARCNGYFYPRVINKCARGERDARTVFVYLSNY